MEDDRNPNNGDQCTSKNIRYEHKKIVRRVKRKRDSFFSKLASPLKKKTLGRRGRKVNYHISDDDDEDPKEVKKKKTTKATKKVVPKIPEVGTSSQNDTATVENEPSEIFKRLVNKELVKLILEKEKIDDANLYRQLDEKLKMYLEQCQKTKSRLKEYNNAKALLEYEICQQDILRLELMPKINDIIRVVKENKEKRIEALEKIKYEAVQKNEEFKEIAWREYIENFQNSLNSSLKNAFELDDL